MKRFALFLALAALIPVFANAQGEWTPEDEYAFTLDTSSQLVNTTIYRLSKPDLSEGDTVWVYILPELPVYPPMQFKNEAQRRKFNKLVSNVKRVLPLARKARIMLTETYETLETIKGDKAKDEHIKMVEKELKREFTPEMKKLTYSQGKLLIKLIDRECNQTSYEIVQAFLGPARATFYQMFAWTFKASLKKQYDAEGDDRMIERVVRQIEAGQL